MARTSSPQLRNKVLETFAQLMETQSFSTVRVTAIVQASHVSQQSFYRLFQSKYDLAIVFFSEQLAAAATVCGKKGTIREVMMTVLTIIKNNAKIYSNLLCDQEGIRIFPEILTKLSHDWTGFSPAWATTTINANILQEWAQGRFTTAIEDIYYQFLSSLPAYELIPSDELEERIHEYENLKSNDFHARKHQRIHH